MNNHNNNNNNNNEYQNQPLLEGIPVKRTQTHQAMSQLFESTAHLAKRLPTGVVMAHTIISPILTSQGDCNPITRAMTIVFIALCTLASLALSFTDSFKAKDGKVCYGVATLNGIWVIDGKVKLSQKDKERFKIKVSDYLHAFMTLLTFVAIVLGDKDTVKCVYPTPCTETRVVLALLPSGIGLICGVLFVLFPFDRHCIGFPLTPEKEDDYDEVDGSFVEI